MSSALLSASSVTEITHQSQPNEDVKKTLRKPYTRPIFVQPPDKGWGWVVVFAAFTCSAIVDGLVFSFPCIFGLLLDDIHANYWVAILVAAVQIFSYLVFGPVISRFLRQDTCRQFVCSGSIAATFGFVFSAIVASELPSDFYFIIVFTLGLAVGCGLGCIYISSLCAVSCFFARHRIAATSIALSGSGVGMTVFPPIIAHFTKTFGFYETMFFFAAITFQTLFLGTLIWPLTELPPGCDPNEGQLPREKDIFDYIRERAGYPSRSIAGSRDSDISFHTRQDAVKMAREQRITRLRNESESESQHTGTRVPSVANSPRPSATMSPLREYINKRIRKNSSKTNGDVPTPSPLSTRSGVGTPAIRLHQPALSISVENLPRPSSRPQSTIPDHVFSIGSRTNSPMPQPDMTSLAGGVSMVENISVITDLGRRLDNCSDISEFFLILDPRELTNSEKNNSLEVPRHNPRQKSVSECIHADGTSSGGVILYDESFTPPDTALSPSDGQCRIEDETLVCDRQNVVNSPNNNTVANNEDFGGDGRATPETKRSEKSTMESVDGDAIVPRINSDIGELKNGGLEMPNCKRVYRRHSSGYSARVAAASKQRTVVKGEPRTSESNNNNGTPLNSEAVLQMLLSDHEKPVIIGISTPTSAASADVSGDESPAVRSDSKHNWKATNGQIILSSQEVHALKTKRYPWLLTKLVDVRLFTHGPCFPVLCLANAFAMAGIFVPLLFFPLRVIWLDGLRSTLFPAETERYNLVDPARLKAAFLISIAGSVGCIARLGVVIGTELRRSNPLVTTCIAFFVKSVIVVSSPLISEFAVLAVMLAFIAVSTELYVSMTTSIIKWCFQPEGIMGGELRDPLLVNPAFSLLTVIRAISALVGICLSGYLFSLADPSGSCFMIMPKWAYRALPTEPELCDKSFANIMYFAGSMFFISFILHSILLAKYALRSYKTKKVPVDSPEDTGNGSFVLQKIDGSRSGD